MRRRRAMRRPRVAIPVVLLLAVALCPGPAGAKLLGNEVGAQNCATAIGGDVRDSSVTVVCGMPNEQVVALVAGLTSPDPTLKAQALDLLRARLPDDTQFRVEAIARFFEILGEQNVETERLADTFARIAEEHLQLRARLRAFQSDDPEVAALRGEAAEALEGADHDQAKALLEAARLVVRAKREALMSALAAQTLEVARLTAEQGDVERARLALADAAQLYDEAAELAAPHDPDAALTYRSQAAEAWY